MDASNGNIIWNELMTHDVEKAKAFCTKAFGWTFSSMPGAGGDPYWVCEANGKGFGGIFEMKDPAMKDMAEHWMPYVAVGDVDASYKTAIAAGAQSCREPFDIPNVGRIAIYNQPGGAMIGIIKPNPRQS